MIAKPQKINKRILRAEYAEISPEAYIPDEETQARLNPNRIFYEIHQYVPEHVEKVACVLSFCAWF